jgi:hypothetical protein
MVACALLLAGLSIGIGTLLAQRTAQATGSLAVEDDRGYVSGDADAADDEGCDDALCAVDDGTPSCPVVSSTDSLEEGFGEVAGLSRADAIELVKRFRAMRGDDVSDEILFNIEYRVDTESYRVHAFQFVGNP